MKGREDEIRAPHLGLADNVRKMAVADSVVMVGVGVEPAPENS